jgi:hypothetical protein
MRRFIFALVICVAIAGIATAGELVVNGGFETGDFTGWTLSGITDHTGVDPNFAYQGNFGAKLGAVGGDGFLFQILPTEAGQMYTLSYALENVGDTPNDFGASWGGVSVPGSEFVNVGPFPGTIFKFLLTATSSSTELQFHFRQDPSFWGLDIVSVQAVPEPASLALTGLGLLAAAGLRKFRK